MKKITFLLTVVLLVGIYLPADAIPSFGRKYQLSCQVCHNPIPRLKPFGDEFVKNGFRLLDQEAPRYIIPTGDPTLSLLRELPLSVRIDGFVKVDQNMSQKTDFAAPYIVKLMSGGELSPKLSYYFYFYFDENGHVAGVEDAFLMYRSVFGSKIDVMLGQFAVSDPLYKAEIRLTLNDYHIYKAKPGFSSVNLSYDKGIMLVYANDAGTDVVLQVVNGKGLNEAGGSGKFFDHDKYKNLVARVSQDIGDNFRLGLFGYLGKELMPPLLAGSDVVNKVVYWGPDATLSFGDKLELNLQYLFRTDSDLGYLASQSGYVFLPDAKTQGGLAELIFMPKGDESKWYAMGMVNYVKSDDPDLNHTSFTAHFGYTLRRNIRLVSEYTLFENSEGKMKNRLSSGFVMAF